MQDRKAKPKPFENSLRALAQITMHETGADGFAFFRVDPETSAVILHEAGGIPISDTSVAGGNTDPRLVAYPLANDGIVAFTFPDEDLSGTARPQLDRAAVAIQAVWAAARSTSRYAQLASQVADLEVCLLDSKIADRVRGMLSSAGAADTLEAIALHVEGILRPASTRRTLERISRELEDEMEERRLTNRAKAILQSVHGMSEEQAHIHLRQSSRRTRKRLKDVALDLIESHPATRSGAGSMT
jgi:hypothetical protein